MRKYLKLIALNLVVLSLLTIFLPTQSSAANFSNAKALSFDEWIPGGYYSVTINECHSYSVCFDSAYYGSPAHLSVYNSNGGIITRDESMTLAGNQTYYFYFTDSAYVTDEGCCCSWDSGKWYSYASDGDLFLYTCTVCGAKRENVGHVHNYSKNVIQPTCTAGGYTEYTCACGDSYIDDHTAALGHNLVISVYGYSPTCTDPGMTDSKRCTRCSYQILAESIPALGHIFEDGYCIRCGIEDDPCIGFEDLKKSDWYYDAAGFVLSWGIMGSTSTDKLTFEPKAPCTRAMIATMLYSLDGKPAVSFQNRFPDVKANQWYTPAAMWAYQNNVLTGYDNGKFGPNDKVTREQMAVILKSYTENILGYYSTESASLSGFADASKVTWSAPFLRWAVAKGLLSGKSNNGKLYLDPQGNATRAEVAAIMKSFVSNIVCAEPEPNNDLRVALITDYGYVFDGSFNEAAWNGISTYCDEFGLEYSYYKPYDDSFAARQNAISQAYYDGYNVFVLPGWLFGENIISLQDMYPDAYFIGLDISQDDLTYDYETFYEPSRNTICFTYREEEAGFLAGYYAVKCGYEKLAFLGGMALPAVDRYGYGFVQGADLAARELNKTNRISVNYVYANQFFGDDTITRYMKNLYRDGTQVTFTCGGGVYTSACEAAAQYNGKIIGVDVDQANEINSFGSNMALTSAIKNLSYSVYTGLYWLQFGDWINYGGSVINGGIVFDIPELSFVSLAPSTQWSNVFTYNNYIKLLGRISSGEITISSDTDFAPSTAITVNYLGNIY